MFPGSVIKLVLSMIIRTDNTIQELYMAKGIHEIVLVRNTKSNRCHHQGVSVVSVRSEALAINNRGVAKQCIIHNILANEPYISEN